MKQIIGIIGGNGLMGNFFAEIFRKQGFTVIVSDKNTKFTNKEIVEKSDIIFFSVPIHVTEKVIREIIPFTRKNQILLDFTSLKINPIKEMMKGKAEVIGLHPMFRPNSSGLKNQTIILCKARASSEKMAFIKNLFTSKGAKVIEMTAKEHDKLMSIIQVLLHFHTIVLGHTLRALKIPIQETLKVASPIYRLEMDVIGRIFSQDPLLYGAIEMLNPLNKKVIKTLEKETKKLSEIIFKKDFKTFEKFFNKTSEFIGSFKNDATTEIDRILNQ